MDRSPDELRAELASLETAEAKLSAERRHVHNQIDYGYATDATHAREREVSDERRQLHERIDAFASCSGRANRLRPSRRSIPSASGRESHPKVAAAEGDD